MKEHASVKKISSALLAFALAAFSIALLHTPHSKALTGSDFQAGRIIDDAVFTDTSSMSVQDINNFLSAKVPSCDTNGTQPYAGTTRAAYGRSAGHPPPYVCLKDYRENPNTHQNNLSTGGSVSGGVTAGEIIYYAAQAYHINPQVLLVTLQKEQGLVTDDWPWTNQYLAAMGYACPDDGSGCHSAYAGFAVQINSAAWQFRQYLNDPSSYNFIGGQNNYIGYYPCANGSTVFIQNQSTAGLYDYTPYQPSAKVLAYTNPTGSSSGPGVVPTGANDGCSTYGNRNFWWYFNTWFGSSLAINGSIQMGSSLQVTGPTSPYIGDTVTASYQVKNTASFDIDAGGLGVCARMNGQNYDFGFIDHKIVPANGTATVSFSKKLDTAGALNLFTCSYNSQLGWASSFYPYDINGDISRQANLTVSDSPIITSGLILGPANFAINQPVTAYLSIKNFSSADINIGSLTVAARDPGGGNVDFPIKNDVIIPANSQANLTWTRSFTTPGNYTFYLAHWNGVWDTSYPHSASESIVRQVKWPVLDNPLITSGISFSPASPAKGQSATATVTVRNVSSNPINIGSLVVAGRDPKGNNVDFQIENDFTIPAGGTKTYSEQRTFNATGSYRFYIAHWQGQWDTSYPKSIDGSVVRLLNLSIN
jgi:hypothetical protein